MALIVWDETISVHIPHIDQQHQELIGWINNLSEAIDNGEGELAVERVLQKLIDYVAEHFAQEELLMISYDFPGLGKHRKEHNYFVQRLKEIQAEFRSGLPIGQNTYIFLTDWLICHIKGTDQKYSGFILKQSVEPEPDISAEDEARRAKIEAIREQLASGSYLISGKDVAGKILDVIKG